MQPHQLPQPVRDIIENRAAACALGISLHPQIDCVVFIKSEMETLICEVDTWIAEQKVQAAQLAEPTKTPESAQTPITETTDASQTETGEPKVNS
jgi:hypothetical protein